MKIPVNYDYSKIRTLSLEAIEKLTKVSPRSIGQAERIPGITPNDINILIVYLSKHKNK